MASKYGPEGTALVRKVRAELRADGLEPDARELVLLDKAARLADRMARLEELIEEDGERQVLESGAVKLHPAVAEYRMHATSLARVLGGVAMADNAAGKDPVKQRAAATRWREHNIAKAAADGVPSVRAVR